MWGGGSAGNERIQICLEGALNVPLERNGTLAEADTYRL